MIEIRQGDRRGAFEVPFNIYGKDSAYVSPMWSDLDRMLDPVRNPLVRDGHGRFVLFTAHQAGIAVGRIVAAIHDASNTRHGTARGQFGFLDCGNDREVFTRLIGEAETWVSAQGAREIVGNFNLTAMQMAGVVTDGFSATPHTDMMWNPPHIARLLTEEGYAPFFPMTTFETDLASIEPGALSGVAQQNVLSDPDYVWEPITRRNFKRQLEAARLILNAGFDQNPMFVPVSTEEYLFQAGEMMWILDPRLSVIVSWRGQPAAVIVCIPDLNPFLKASGSRLGLMTPWHFMRHRLTRDRAVIIYYSVIPELHGRGLNGAMLGKLVASAKAAGYRTLGTTWIADVNEASLRQMQRMGAKPLHRLHLFRKDLG
jgi:GNAT superfamily N-acetyltransferase